MHFGLNSAILQIAFPSNLIFYAETCVKVLSILAQRQTLFLIGLLTYNLCYHLFIDLHLFLLIWYQP